MIKMMKGILVVIILVCVAIGIFGVAPNVSAEEKDEVIATVVDINSDENTNIHDLDLYWTSGNRYDYKSSILVSKGESELTIPLNNIKEIEFIWDDETPTVTVTVLSDEKIKGEPLRVLNWYFRGETGFGDFKLSVSKTKKVIFSHEMMPTSPTPTPVTTTPTPILTQTTSPTATQASVPGPIPTTTPTTSSDQIPTPISRVPGFEVLSTLVALMVVSLLTRKRRAK